MARRASSTRLKPPFLRRALFKRPDSANADAYPWTLPLFRRGSLDIAFEKPVTVFVGDNGSGKSTVLEAIAAKCGFSLQSGSRDHAAWFAGKERDDPLQSALTLSWLPKVTQGFFFRAESVFNFARRIDTSDDPLHGPVWDQYGGRPLLEHSHGEGFFRIFANRFARGGLFILDEPESALIPQRQLAFLRLIKEGVDSGRSQFVIATHSPIIMSYPGADVFEINAGRLARIAPSESGSYRLLQSFFMNPSRVVEEALAFRLEAENDE